MNEDLLEALIAAGTPAALVAQVARLIADAEAVQRRRAADAARQRQARSSRDVTLRHVTSRESADVTNEHIDKITSSSSESQNKKRKKVSLPENWSLSETDAAFAREQGWPEDKIKLEAHRFYDHARANDRKQLDWHATWRNWVTSPYQQKANGHGKPKESLVDIGRRLAAEARELERAAGIKREDDPIGSD